MKSKARIAGFLKEREAKDSATSGDPQREVTIGLTCRCLAHEKLYVVALRRSVVNKI